MNDTTTFRPKWDARQEYSKTLVELLNQLKFTMEDEEAWYKLLRTYYSITSPFIDSEKRKQHKLELQKIIELIEKSSTQKIHNYKGTIRTLLFDIQDELINSTSHLLLSGDDLLDEDEDDLL